MIMIISSYNALFITEASSKRFTHLSHGRSVPIITFTNFLGSIHVHPDTRVKAPGVIHAQLASQSIDRYSFTPE